MQILRLNFHLIKSIYNNKIEKINNALSTSYFMSDYGYETKEEGLAMQKEIDEGIFILINLSIKEILSNFTGEELEELYREFRIKN